jgi:hypothetical protein
MRRISSGQRSFAATAVEAHAPRHPGESTVMSLAELTDPVAVDAALDGFDRLGREAFLRRYGFRPSRTYFLERDGKRYDSKAIVGAAFGFQHPEWKSLVKCMRQLATFVPAAHTLAI